jgi:hypothetical protein
MNAAIKKLIEENEQSKEEKKHSQIINNVS